LTLETERATVEMNGIQQANVMNISNIFSDFGKWDIILILVVSIGGTLSAYIHHPRWKAFVLLTPLPFTFATLALGQPINATHMSALIVLLGYTFAVRLLHQRFRLPIVWAIALSATAYCIIGGLASLIIPRTDTAFLIAAVVVMITAAIIHSAMPNRQESGQQSPLPVWIKVIVVASVIFFITIIKTLLQGFMTTFPMLGVVVAYESRNSLYTVCRHIPVAMLGLVPMMTTIFVLQESIGLGLALLAGWVIYLIVLPLLIIPLWKKYENNVVVEADKIGTD
jgi:uncharacterized membrane protein YjjB (DUF3815 family)